MLSGKRTVMHVNKIWFLLTDCTPFGVDSFGYIEFMILYNNLLYRRDYLSKRIPYVHPIHINLVKSRALVTGSYFANSLTPCKLNLHRLFHHFPIAMSVGLCY
jgi:hypothetical protein